MSIEDEIKLTLTSLVDAFEAKKEADFGEMVTRLFETKKGEYWWETPENFWLGFVFPAKKALEVALQKKYPHCTQETLRHVFAIYANYSAIEEHIQWFLQPFEGSSAITDKSRRLIDSHLKWLLEEPKEDNCFDRLHDRKDPNKRGWNCPQKGTPEQWHEYMLGLTFFFGCGDTVQIIKPYMELVNLYLEDQAGETGASSK